MNSPPRPVNFLFSFTIIVPFPFHLIQLPSLLLLICDWWSLASIMSTPTTPSFFSVPRPLVFRALFNFFKSSSRWWEGRSFFVSTFLWKVRGWTRFHHHGYVSSRGSIERTNDGFLILQFFRCLPCHHNERITIHATIRAPTHSLYIFILRKHKLVRYKQKKKFRNPISG